MKKILYVHGNSDIIGGVEIFIENALFKHKKFEAHAIFINDGELPKRIRNNGFNKNIVCLNGGRLRAIPKTLCSILKIVQYIKKSDISIVIGNGQHAWIYAGLAAKLGRVKGVFYCHAIIKKADVQIPNFIGFIASLIKPSLIFAVSMLSKDTTEKYLKVKAEILYPGFDLSRFRANIDISTTQQNLSIVGKKIVTMIGRIQEWKGQEYFIKSMPLIISKIPGAHFLIVGWPTFRKDDAYLQKLKNIVNELYLENYVTFTGFRNDIPEIISLSDVIVHASIKPEPFGLVITEAMAAGKPVIATNIGGPTEIIQDSVDGFLIPPKNENILSQRIVELLKNEDMLKEIGERAKMKANKNFSIEKCISNMEDILERIL